MFLHVSVISFMLGSGKGQTITSCLAVKYTCNLSYVTLMCLCRNIDEHVKCKKINKVLCKVVICDAKCG